jgi:ribonuclease HI
MFNICVYYTSILTITENIGFSSHHFFTSNSVQVWLKEGATSSRSIIFLSGLWWIWRHRNLMCLGNETLSLTQLCSNIYSLVETISSAFHSAATAPPPDRFIRWNNNNLQCTILNIDGSCSGDPIRTAYGGILKDHSGSFISIFSGFINHSQDILFAELSALYQGLILAINLNYEGVTCYSDSLLTVNLIKEDLNHFHVYAVLIQNIKDLLSSRNFSLHHSLRQGNQCADFLAKLGASNDVDLAIHSNPPEGLPPLLQSDELGTLFLRR